MLKAALTLMGVETPLSVSYSLPSTVAVAVGIMPVNEPVRSRVLSIYAIPAGLKYMFSAPSFRATPVCPIPICLVERELI